MSFAGIQGFERFIVNKQLISLGCNILYTWRYSIIETKSGIFTLLARTLKIYSNKVSVIL